MNRNYQILFENRILVLIMLILCLLVSAWVALPEARQEHIWKKCLKRKYKGNNFIEQIFLLISILLTNIFTCISLGDYWKVDSLVSFFVCFVQIIGIIRLFVHVKKPDGNIKRALFLGFLSLILDFTNIYAHFYYFIDREMFIGLNDPKPFELFCEFFFYSVSLVLPYPLTEIIAKGLMVKTISLGQIVLFTLFIFKKLSEIIENNKVGNNYLDKRPYRRESSKNTKHTNFPA